MTQGKLSKVDRRGFFRTLFGRGGATASAPLTAPSIAPSSAPLTAPSIAPSTALTTPPTPAASSVPGVVAATEPFSLSRFYEAREATRSAPSSETPPPPSPSQDTRGKS